MRYTSLELVGFKRMQLNQVGHFTIKPTEPIQLILGTNGSGKSSLIGELTPLPPNAADYFKEGSKTIKLTHRGSSYVLHSKFSPKPHHSFLKDGEEMNPGGTGSVQKELVRQEFSVTAEIHELLIGREQFTRMDPRDRRVWFTQLSDINYDYALGVYKKLKDRVRDTSGALKLAKKRLVAEQAKVISAAEEERLKKEVKEINHELEMLQGQRAPVERPIEAYQYDLHVGLEELSRMSMRLIRMRFIAPYGHHPNQQEIRNDWGELILPGFQNLDDITRVIDEYRTQVQLKEALINQAVSEHGKIKETVRVLQRTGEEGVKALHTKRDKLREERDGLLKRRKLGLEGVDAANALSALESVQELLQTVFDAIPENENRRFSSEKLAEVESKIYAAKDRRQKKTSEVMYLNTQKQHMEAHKNSGDLTCPKCSHKWILGYSDTKFEQLMELIAKEEDAGRAIDKEIAALEEEARLNREYGEFYRDYIRTQRNWPVLNAFWDHLQQEGYVVRAPRKVLSVVDTFKQDLVLEVEAKRIEDQLADLFELIKQSEQVGDASLSEQQTKLGEVTLQIEELTAGLTKAKAAVNDYSNYRRQLLESEELSAKIVTLRDQLTKTNADMIEMLRRDTLNHCIRKLQHSLVHKEETLAAVTLQKGIIADLDQSITRMNIEEEAAKALERELSPTDGLIAEGLLMSIAPLSRLPPLSR